MTRAEARLRLIEIVCGRNPHLKEALHIIEIVRELEKFVLDVAEEAKGAESAAPQKAKK